MPYNVSDTGPAAYDLQKQQMSQEQMQGLLRLILSLRQARTAQNQWQSEQSLREQQAGQQASQFGQELGLRQQEAGNLEKYRTGELGVRTTIAQQAAAKEAWNQMFGVAKFKEQQGVNETDAAYKGRMAAAAETRATADTTRATKVPAGKTDPQYGKDYKMLSDSMRELDNQAAAIKSQRAHPLNPMETLKRMNPDYVDPLATEDQRIAASKDRLNEMRSGMTGPLDPAERSEIPSLLKSGAAQPAPAPAGAGGKAVDPFDASPVGSTRTSKSTGIRQVKTPQGWVTIK